MSQSHYHVFLPPILSSLAPPIPRLSFQDLVVSREVESQLDFGYASQVSRLKRISQSQSQSQSYPSGNDRKGKAKQEAPEHDVDTITQYTWPPTPFEVIGSGNSSKKRLADEGDTSRGNTIKRSRAPLTLSGNTTHTTEAGDQDLSVGTGGGSGSGLRRKSSRVRKSGSGILGTFPDLETQDESFLSLDTTISSLPPSGEVSSVLNLPKWSIPLTKLSSLPTLLQSHKEPSTISVIVCVLSVDTPILRQRKEEKRRGQDGSLWIGGWVVTAPNIWVGYAPQGDGGGCGVKLWGEAAREWGDEVVRKGDVVLLEHVTFKPPTSTDAAQITISSTPPSKITILYRTLPRYHLPSNPYAHITSNENGAKVVPGDRELRPDLRLGRSDLGVRRVAEVVRWFAGFIGGDAPL